LAFPARICNIALVAGYQKANLLVVRPDSIAPFSCDPDHRQKWRSL